ncbi:MAG: tyrosine-type recombinase/integrase [Terriglobales bacterium]
MELFKRKNSKCWWYDFAVRGERYRGSTKETNKTAAQAKAARLLTDIAESRNLHCGKKAPVLSDFADRFLAYLMNAKLADNSKRYLRCGWKLLEQTRIIGMRMSNIRTEDIDALTFPGSAYNVNCALKTLRRMLNLAHEWGLIGGVPRIRLMKELGRSIRLDEEAERKLLAYARQPLRDVIILMRDTGMRNRKELFRMRIENLDWNTRTIFVPDSKTPTGRRYIPMSDRVLDLLMIRCGERREGWVFPANSAAGHLTTLDKQFREVRKAAGLPKNLVLYSARHDFGTRVLQKTGNLAAVMRVMGHSDPRIAMHYQHPDLEVIRQGLNVGSSDARVQ